MPDPKPRRTPKDKPPSASLRGQLALLREDMRSQNRLTIEAVESTSQRLEQKIDQVQTDLGQRIDVLTMVVQSHSQTLAQHGQTLAQHSQTLAQHGQTLAQHSQTLAEHGQTLAEHGQTLRRIESKVDTLVDLDRRVTVLERKRG